MTPGLERVAPLSERWLLATAQVQELAWFHDEDHDGLHRGDALVVGDLSAGVVHSPALVLGLDPEPSGWPADEHIVVDVSLLVDRRHAPIPLGEIHPRLAEQVDFGQGAVRDEMRSCLLDLWGMDLTCPRCAGRGGRLSYGLVAGEPGFSEDPDDVPVMAGCDVGPFPHRYACRYCAAQWGGAPRFGDPRLLDLARDANLLTSDEESDLWSTPVSLRWLDSLLDGVGEYVDGWQVERFFEDFDSRYGRTVGVDLRRGDDALELEYNPDGSRASAWDLAVDGSDGPHASFTVRPAEPSVRRTLEEAGLFGARPDLRDTVILGWNPAKWAAWDPAYDDAVARTRRGEAVEGTWNVANRRNIAPGTEVYLLLQGSQRGLVGHGRTTGWPFEDAHYAEPDRQTTYVPVRWDTLLPFESRIPREVLERDVPDVGWRTVYSSGRSVPGDPAAALRELWVRETG